MKYYPVFLLGTAFAANSSTSVIDTENPNGFDPLFDWNIVGTNELLAKYNVTYTDLINKPIQLKILLQTLYEQGQTWYELCVAYGDDWLEEFSAVEVNERTMLNWARDMEDIIEETMEIIRWGMEDLEQIIYPWGIYNTADIESEFIDPYITAIIKVLNWSGESVYRYWSMLFGINGWVITGEEWIVQWETDFQWHKLSDVTRDLRRFTEEWKVNTEVGLDTWEDIICGPRLADGSCLWYTADLAYIISYTFDYLLIILDKLDEAVEWFALVIGNILDATVNKNPARTG